MRRYLVTGSKGWLAGELDRRLATFPGEYSLARVPVRGDAWLDGDWSGYDGVLHFASVVYGGDPESVNAALAGRVAAKCAADGVPWMLLMSSFAVYGAEVRPNILVDRSTEPEPATPYGRSKLAAERSAERALEGSATRLAVVRAPLVYGPGQRNGSFPVLMAFARRAPFFPETRNERSMVYSQNLCELCRLLADAGAEGMFLPQDGEYHDTATLVKGLAERQGGKVRIVGGTSGLAKGLAMLSPKLGKLFGSARYDVDASDCGAPYRIVGPSEALDATVGGEAR